MPEHEPISQEQIILAPSKAEAAISDAYSLTLEKPSILVFHEKVKETGVYGVIDEQRQILIEAYFTTEHSFATLAQQFGIPRTTAQFLVSTGLQTVFEHLPPEIQQEYRSAKNVIQLKPHTWKHNQEAIEHVKEAQKNRWHRYRQRTAK